MASETVQEAYTELDPWADPFQTRISGEAVRAARKARGWSEQKLAEHLGVADASINRWELGRVQPMPVFRAKLAKFITETNAAMLGK